MLDKALTLAAVCDAVASGDSQRGADLLARDYPFVPLGNEGRHYSPTQLLKVFIRDGFVDRYSGANLVFPGALLLLSKLLPEAFPYHRNWKSDSCHFAYYELFPTIDHVIPVSRGGDDAETNWVSTSMLRNSAKANFTVAELGWSLHPTGNPNAWDGCMAWFTHMLTQRPDLKSDPQIRKWFAAARSAEISIATIDAAERR